MTTHVFIVGLPRTGTTLMSRVLNASPDIGIAGESRFLPWSRRFGLVRRAGFGERAMPKGMVDSEAQLDQAVAAVFSPRATPFWRKLAATTTTEEFRARLATSGRTRRDLLDLALAYHAGGKPVRGEKTPAHIHSVPTLLDWFPDARIVHMRRDPRAVYVSNLKKYDRKRLPLFSRLIRSLQLPFQLYSSLDLILEWRRIARLHRTYARAYPNRYRAVQFDDLVLRPEPTIRSVCEFLGVPYSAQMLDQVVANSSFVARDTQAGFDSAATQRWRRHLDPLVARWFMLWAGDRLRRAGYEPDGAASSSGSADASPRDRVS